MNKQDSLVAALKSQLRKAENRAAKLEVETISLKARLATLKKELERASAKTDLEALIVASNK